MERKEDYIKAVIDLEWSMFQNTEMAKGKLLARRNQKPLQL